MNKAADFEEGDVLWGVVMLLKISPSRPENPGVSRFASCELFRDKSVPRPSDYLGHCLHNEGIAMSWDMMVKADWTYGGC